MFPRKRGKHASNRQRKCSAPLTSATYAGTTLETTTMTTRSTVGPHVASPVTPHHVPVSKLIPDVDEESTSQGSNVMTAAVVVNNANLAATPTVHITINDHFVPDDNFRISRPVTSVFYSGNAKGSTTTAGTVNETFVQDNGVVVTVL